MPAFAASSQSSHASPQLKSIETASARDHVTHFVPFSGVSTHMPQRFPHTSDVSASIFTLPERHKRQKHGEMHGEGESRAERTNGEEQQVELLSRIRYVALRSGCLTTLGCLRLTVPRATVCL